MNSHPKGAWRGAAWKPALAGLLGLLLLLTAFASASPCLHHWLHTDHQSASHYCVVTALEQGQNDVVVTLVLVGPVADRIEMTAVGNESFFVSHDLTLFPERGPPCPS